MKLEELERSAEGARREERQVVVVLGLGFVGAAVLANLARTRRAGQPVFLAIGLEQDNPAGRERVAAVVAGRPPVFASDASLAEVFRVERDAGTAVATIDGRVLELADVVVVAIGLDLERPSGQTEVLSCDVEGFAEALAAVGRRIPAGTLVVVESTLPVGSCEQLLYPALCRGQAEQGIDTGATPPRLAYCYERVMPGPGYLDSVNAHWRAFAGIDAASAAAAETFLSSFVDTERFPLWPHRSLRAAELAKLLENAYRATNIAFIDEWARLAEEIGVDLFDVIDSIRVRQGTHDNMMRPGLGVGGYCLTKDPLLAAFGAERLLGVAAPLPLSRRAVLINERMPLRVYEMAAARFGGRWQGKRAALFGVTYRVGVADSRSSPAEPLARALRAEGMTVVAADSCVDSWPELPEVELLPLARAAEGIDLAVICLPDPALAAPLPGLLAAGLRDGGLVVDAWNLIADTLRQQLVGRDVELRVYGRGDLERPELVR